MSYYNTTNETGSTLKDVKQYLKDNYEKGCACPACGQFVKLYKRKLNSGMARTLIAMHRHRIYHFVNIKEFLKENKLQNNHDWTLLKHWGLIEEEKNDDPVKKSSGKWRVTKKGWEFVTGGISLYSHVILYNNKLQGFSDTRIKIKDALGNKFNYPELMGYKLK